MKSIFLFRVAFSLLLLLPACLQAQPEFKSDVQKEYDENGNINLFDSCWSWSYRSGPGFDLDSVLGRFFQHRHSSYWDHFPAIHDSIWEYGMHFNFPDSFQLFGPHTDFPDHFFDDFYRRDWDSIIEIPFRDPFFYGENLDDFFEEFPAFPHFENHLREHLDKMQEYLYPSPFKADTILHYQHLRPPPGQQKNPSRPIEI